MGLVGPGMILIRVINLKNHHSQFMAIRPDSNGMAGIFSSHPLIFIDLSKELTSALISRELYQNQFIYKPWITGKKAFDRNIPFQYSPDLLTKLLSDTLSKPVQYIPFEEIPFQPRQTFSIPMPDTLYALLMQDSDNFIAEQLLLMCSDKIFGVQNTEKAIDYAVDALFETLPDEPVWRDGSGLSRYNLFTPRRSVHVLNKLYRTLPGERLFHIFPAGGKSGTIEKWYGGKAEP